LNQGITPLPAHPPPESGASIGQWIEKLAEANKTSFRLILFHIIVAAKQIGFLEALAALTRVSITQIQQLSNEFRPTFWEDMKQCPIQNCEYRAKFRPTQTIFRHLRYIHNLGIKWFRCPQPDCEYKTTEKYQLKRHLQNLHNVEFKWHECPFCEY